MPEIQIIAKDNHKTLVTTEGTSAKLSEASVVLVKVAASDVLVVNREGTNAVIRLKNGETIVIEGFFSGTAEPKDNSLVFQDENGQLIWAKFKDAENDADADSDADADADSDVEPQALLGEDLPAALPAEAPQELVSDVIYQPISSIEPLLYHDAGVNPWLWAAIPLVAGGIIAAASNHDSNDDSSAPIDTTPPATPSVPSGYLDNVGADQGIKGSGSSTDDTTPGVVISAPGAGETPALYVDGVKVPASYDPVTGTLTPTTPLADGSHQLTYTLTDAAGNESAQSPALTVTVDTLAPATPAVPSGYLDNVGADQGIKGSGSSTDDTTPGVVISAPGAGETPALYVDGVKVPASYDPVTGTLTPTTPLADGSHQLTYTLTDAAGNESAQSPALTVTVDTLAPATPAVPSGYLDNVGADQGIKGSGSSTDDTTPGVVISAPGAGETPALYVDGVKVPASYDPVTGTLTPTTPLADGSHQLTYTLTDAAGNESAQSPALTVTVDTLAPATPAVPSGYLDNVGADQGIKGSGSSTDDTTPGVVISAPGAGETPALYVDGVKVPASYDPVTGTLTPTTPLADGSHQLTYTLTDAAGNESAQSPALTVTVDTLAPATPAVPSGYLDNVGADQGIKGSGSSTDDTTPGVVISAPGAGETPALYVDGVKVPASYDPVTGTLTPTTPLADGSHQLTYTLTDAAGNESAQSPALTVTVDTLAPATPAVPSGYLDNVGADQGIKGSGSSTDDTTPGVVISAPGAGETPALYVDGVKVPASYDPVTGTLTPTTPLADGSHQLTYTLTDAAGNESAQSPALTVTVDTLAPATPAVPSGYLDNVGADQGIKGSGSSTDDTTPGVVISAPGAGETPALYVDGVKVPASYDPVTGTLTPTTPLADGSHQLTYTLTDAAGNESAQSPALTVTVDTLAPATPAVPSGYLDNVGADQGIKGSGSSTDDTTPGVVISAPGAGETPALYVDGVKVPASYDPVTGTLTPTTPLADGSHQLTYTLTDAAGNESAQSPALTVTVDTLAPATPAVPSGYLDNVGADQGIKGSGSSTDDTTPGVVISAPGAGETPALYVDGVKVPASYDPVTGTLTPTTPLADGSHQLTYTLTDAAGNESAQSPALTVTVDTLAPATPAVPSGYLDNVGADQGIKGSGSSTDDTTPGVVISAPGAGETPALYVDGVKVPASYDPVTGTLTPTTPLADGSHQLTYTLTDAAGNESAQSPALTVTVDTLAPATPAVPSGYLDNVGADQGIKGSGSSTDDTTPGVVISAPGAGETPALYVDGVKVPASYDPVTGTLTPTTPLADGSHQLTYTLTDAAGNESAQSPALTVTVDTLAPTLSISTSDLVLGSGEITTITFEFSEPVIGFVSTDIVTTGGTLSNLIQVDANTWTATFTQSGSAAPSISIANGAYSDAVGNVGIGDVLDGTDGFIFNPAAVDLIGAITIPADVNGDGIINASELGTDGTVDAQVALTGATLGSTVTINGTAYTVTQADLDAGFITAPISVTADGALTITATATDAQGNVDSSSLSVTVDTAAVDLIGAITIPADVNGDGIINASELGTDGIVDAQVALTGATLGSTVTINGTAYTVTQADLDAGFITAPISVTADGALTITATATDAQGNVDSSSLSVTVDTAAVDLIGAITIPADVNGDGIINASELGTDGTVDAQVALTGATLGSTVTINGTAYTVTQADLDAGFITAPISVTADGALTITATATDAQGNVDSSSLSVTVDTAAVDLIGAITIPADVNGDGIINASELGTDGTVDAQVALTGATLGSTVTINGTAYTVTQADLDAGFITAPISVTADGALTITATATDAQGNVDSSSLSVTVDTAAVDLIGAITIPADVNGDGIINASELGTDGTVDAQVALTGATLGSTVTINGTAYTVTQADLDAGFITAPISVTADGALTITATATDAQGNVDSSSLSVTVDTAAVDLIGAITIPADVNGDGIINASELGTDGTVDAQVALTGATLGSTVTINGTAYTVTQADLDAGFITAPISVTADGALTITATATDAQGNVDSSSLSVTVDTAAVDLIGAITIPADVNGDSIINASELGTDGTVDAQVALTGATLGSTVTINGTAYTVTQADLDAGFITAPISVTADGALTITATATDAQGNVDSSSLSVTVDTAAVDLIGAITIPADVNGDGIINASELGTDGTVDAQVALTGATLGSTVTINGTAYTVTQADLDAGFITAPISVTADGALTITATATDAQGNVDSSSLSVTVDTAAVDLIGAITIPADVNGDGIINASELGTDGTVDAQVALTGATLGSTVTINGTAYTVTQADLDAGFISAPISVTADGALTITATATDAQGNVDSSSLSVTVDTAAVDLIGAITIPADVNGDGIINASELGTDGTVDAQVALTGATLGSTVTINGTAYTVTQADLDAGFISAPISVTADGALTITATATDAQGNVDSSSLSVTVDTAAVDLIGAITIPADVNGDGIINASELGTDGIVDAQVALTGATLGSTVTINGTAYTVTQADLDAGFITAPISVTADGALTITATATDAQGNVDSSSLSVTVDTAAVDLIGAITIPADVNGDGIINASELGTDGTVDAQVALTGATLGSTVTINGTAYTVTQADLDAGFITAPISVTADGALTITATATDAQGNVDSSSLSVTVDTAAVDLIGAITIPADVNGDGIINASELGTDGTVDAQVALTGATLGSTVTINGTAYTVTQADLDAGFITAPISVTADGALTITATATDAQGNVDSSSLSVTVDTAAVDLIGAITIPADVNGDGIINASELGTDGIVDAQVALTGATLGSTVTINGTAYTVTQADLDAGFITAPISVTADGALTITATATDAQGNVDSSSLSVTVDTAAVDLIGAITIPADVNGDGIINASELGTDGTVDAQVALTGATLGSTVTINGTAYTVTQADLDAGFITAPISVTADGALTITATATDAQGNVDSSSLSVTVDTAAVDLIGAITIPADVNGDGIINASELGTDGTVDAQVALTGATLGSTVTINGTAYTVTQADLDAGFITAPISVTADGALTITATATDAQGNVDSSSLSVTVDTAAVDLIGAITIPADVNGDGIINASELGTDGTVDAQVALTGATLGSTVTINGTAYTVTQADLDAGFITAPISVTADGALTITATATDAQGNVDISSLSVTVDTAAVDLIGAITIPADVNGDGIINASELGTDGTVDAQVALTGATLGSTVTINGTAYTVTQADLDAGFITAPISVTADGALTITATATDAQGNVDSSSLSVTVDTAAVDLIGAITIPADVNGDGIINASELGTDGTVDAQVALTGATLGSTVTINGTAYTVTQADLDAGFITAPISVTADGALTITATATDAQGNVDSSSLSVTVDTAAVDLIGAITIPADVNGDGIINASELGTDGTVDAQVALTGATLGSTVTINGTAYTVTQADLDAGFITAPISVTADGALTITATATDAQGNVDSSSLSVTVDTAAVDLIGAITIPADVNGDGIINASELGTDGTVDAQVALTGATLGSTVTINGTAYTVTQADLDAGFITAPISVTADGALTITATATDAQGNVDSSSLSVTVDTAAVDLIGAITIPADVNGDGIINASELGTDGTVDAQVALTGATLGSTVTINGTAYTVTQADLDAGFITAPISVTADGALTITATATDAQGNVDSSSLSVTVDTAAVDLIGAITIPADVNGDGIINASELGTDGTVDAQVALTGATLGSTVTINGTAYTVTQADLDAGFITAPISVTADGALTITATATDAQGNVDSSSLSVTVDTAAVDLIGAITIPADVNGDGIINASELGTDGTVDAQVALTGATLGSTVTINGTAYTVTQADLDAGFITAPISVTADGALTITATATDAQGNVDSSSLSVTVDTAAVDLIGAITIPADVNGDGIINASELGTDGTVDAQVALTGATLGSTVTINGTAYTVTQADLDAGFITAPISVTADGALTITATATDAQGNVDSSSLSVTVDTAAVDLIGAITIPADVNGDGIINASELGTDGTVDAQVALTGATLGSTVTINGTAYTVTQADLDAGFISAPISVTADGALTITATATDAQGNVDSSSLSVTVDTAAVDLIGAITIPADVNGDGIINASELGTDGIVDAQVALTGATLGSTVTINGTAYTVTQADLDAGFITAPISVTADGALTITATATDAQGNVDSSSLSVTVDTAAVDLIGAITIPADVNGDGIINASELGTDGTVDAQVALTGATLGSTVTINGTAYTVTQADLDAGFITAPISVTADGALTITATATDAQGNVDSSSLSVTVDTAAVDLIGAITIPADVNGDGIINASELGTDGTVDAQVALTGATLGSTVTINGTAYTVTQADLDAGFITAPISVTADGALTITATATDAQGNVDSSSLSVTVDTAAVDLIGAITIPADVNGDGIINASELGTDGTVDAQVALTGATLGSTVTINGTAYTVTQADLDAGFITAPISVTADGALTITATATDAQGNVDSSSLSVTVDTAAVDLIGAITIPADVNGDGIINASELGTDGTVDAQVALTGATLGSTVTINGTAYTVTQADLDAGFITAPISVTADGALTITATATDAQGNVDSSSLSVTVDTAAVDAINDNVTFDPGTFVSTIWDAPIIAQDINVLDTSIIGDTSMNVEFSVPRNSADIGTGHEGDVVIQVSQDNLIAVASGFSVLVEYFDGANWVQYTTATTTNGGLIADALGLGVLGIVDDGKTIAVHLTGVPEGQYRVVVQNDSSAIGDLLDDLTLAQLGDQGILLGADNQDAVLDAVETALNGQVLTLGTLVRNVLEPLLNIANAAGETLAVTDIVAAIVKIPLVGSLLGGVDTVLDYIADALVDNLLSVLEFTNVTINGSETYYTTPQVSGNVFDDNGSGADDRGNSDAALVTKVDGVDVPTDGTDAVIKGLYGTLYINKDGVYRYVLNGSVDSNGQVDDFTYTLSDGTQSDTAVLTISVEDVIAPKAPIVSSLDETTVTGVAGAAEANSVINVYGGTDSDGDGIPDTLLGTTTANPDGSYTVTLNPAIALGDTVVVTSKDAAGNISTPTIASLHNIVALDDPNQTNYELSTTVDRPDISGGIFTLANAGVLGDLIDLDLSATSAPGVTVGTNEQITLTLTASGSTGLDISAVGNLIDAILGGNIGGSLDLIIAKQTSTGSYEVYNTIANAYTLNNSILTFTASGSQSISLDDAGVYKFILAPNSSTSSALSNLLSLNLLGNLVLSSNDVVATINNTDLITGNVLSNDTAAPIGLDLSIVSIKETTAGVDETVVSGAPKVIEGKYGTLTIDSTGAYSYQMTANATALGKVEAFTYTVQDNDGHSKQATIYIRLDSNLVTLDWTGKTGLQEADKLVTQLTADNKASAGTITTLFDQVLNGSGDSLNSIQVTGSNGALPTSPPATGSTAIPDDSGRFTLGAGQTAYISFTSILPSNVTQNFGLGGNQTSAYNVVIELERDGAVLDTQLAIWTSTISGTKYYYKVTNTGTSSADYDLNIAYGDGSGLFNWTNTTGKTFGINNIQLDITGTTYTASTVSGDLISNDLLYSSVFKIGVAAGSTTPSNYLDVNSTSIVGTYGTLTVNLDGTYSYQANGKIADLGKDDVFTYKIETLDGTVNTQTLTIKVDADNVLIGTPNAGTAGNDIAVSQSTNEVFTLGDGADLLIYNVLNGSSPTGGNGTDQWLDFNMSEGDKIDVSSLLSGATATTINNYLSVTISGNQVTLLVDRDGSGSASSPTTLLTLTNEEHATNPITSLVDLLNNNSIIY
ncbi:Ig-like domain-containing protein [Acinetobacter baumannii]